MMSLLSDPTHAIEHRLAHHEDVDWHHLAGAAICALAVGVLAFTMLGGLFMALTGVGMLHMGAPEVLIWSVITFVGAGTLYLSIRLAHHVWLFELDFTGTGHPEL